ncbi:MAG TPA: TPM domain-containing protein [Chitinophaga sp.]
MRIFCWLWLCLLLITGLQTFAQEVPPRPTPPRLVNDLAGVLLRQEADDLERKVTAYNDSTSTQIAIVTVKTVGDYDISETALKILRDWGVGSKEKNNGLVILAAIEDRKVRIETGYGLEGAVPDAIANRIIDQIIVPNFREGHYYQGLDQAVNAIEKAAAGEYKAIPKKRRGKGGGSIFVLIVVAIILLSIINNRRGGGTTISRRGWGGWGGIPMGGGGWSSGSGGGWGGGGGGGGFGGFGGGSGGGGGASGSW